MSVFKRRNKKPLSLSEEEKETVIEEIAKRMKDIVYISARKYSEQLYNERIGAFMNYDTGELFTITYKVTLCAGDLQQIVARVRREKEDERKTR